MYLLWAVLDLEKDGKGSTVSLDRYNKTIVFQLHSSSAPERQAYSDQVNPDQQYQWVQTMMTVK